MIFNIFEDRREEKGREREKEIMYAQMYTRHHCTILDLGCPFVLEQCTKDTYPYLCNTSRTYQCTFDLVSRVSLHNVD